jgi:hypothetical protein
MENVIEVTRIFESMKSPPEMGGMEFFSIWEYKKIVPLQRTEFIQNLADAAGNKMNPVALGMPSDFPEDVPTIVTFKDLGGGKTEMTVGQYADMGQMTTFAKMGLEQSIGKMGRIFGSYHSDYIGQPGDYYDFSPRNMLYTKEGAHTDSMAYEVLPNNQVRCSPSPGFNESYTTSDIALTRATFHVMLITEQGTLTKIIHLTR